MSEIENQLASIVNAARANGFANREEVITWLKQLPADNDILVLARDGDGKVIYGQVGPNLSAIDSCKQFLSLKNVADNPLLKSLQGLLPPGHPLKDL